MKEINLDLLTTQEFNTLIAPITLMDHTLFHDVFQNKDAAYELVSVLMKDKKLRIIDYKVEKIFDNNQNHGVRLDFYCQLSNGTLVNIEIQNSEDVDLMKRSRYYSGSLDTHHLKKGMPYSKLANVYIFWIVPFDYFNKGIYDYYIHGRYMENSKDVIEDGIYIHILNVNTKGTSEIDKYLRFFKDDKEILYEDSAIVSQVKKLKGDRNYMSNFLKQSYSDALEKTLSSVWNRLYADSYNAMENELQLYKEQTQATRNELMLAKEEMQATKNELLLSKEEISTTKNEFKLYREKVEATLEQQNRKYKDEIVKAMRLMIQSGVKKAVIKSVYCSLSELEFDELFQKALSSR